MVVGRPRALRVDIKPKGGTALFYLPFTIDHSPPTNLSPSTCLSYRARPMMKTVLTKMREGLAVKVCRVAALVVCASGFRECYKPVRRSGMPSHIKTIAVPAFQNQALRYRIETRFTDA